MNMIEDYHQNNRLLDLNVADSEDTLSINDSIDKVNPEPDFIQKFSGDGLFSKPDFTSGKEQVSLCKIREDFSTANETRNTKANTFEPSTNNAQIWEITLIRTASAGPQATKNTNPLEVFDKACRNLFTNAQQIREVPNKQHLTVQDQFTINLDSYRYEDDERTITDSDDESELLLRLKEEDEKIQEKENLSKIQKMPSRLLFKTYWKRTEI